MTWVEVQLQKLPSPLFDQEILRFSRLSEFWRLSTESNESHEYSVAWIDCLATGDDLGRGLFTRANPSDKPSNRPLKHRPGPSVPITPPFSLVNRWSLRLFNKLYYARQRGDRRQDTVSYSKFFFPLDAIGNWNRMYGPRGFLQYQCVIPPEAAEEAIADMLKRIAEADTGSFLAVLKQFGDKPSPGLLSFPRPGTTLALDFPIRGQTTFDLLDRLDEITLAAKGAVYPAKDARMSPAVFQAGFPKWRELAALRDEKFSSGFWRRVTGGNV